MSRRHQTAQEGPALPPRRVLPFDARRALLWVLLLGLAALCVFIVVVRVDRVVVGSGTLVGVDDRADVSPATGGIVSQVLAKEGDHVVTGQTLLALEDAEVVGALERLRRARESSERVRRAQRETADALRRALDGRTTGPIADASVADAVETWRDARDQLAELHHEAREVIPAQEDQARARVAAREAALESLRAQLTRATSEADREAQLLERELTDAVRYEAAVAQRDSLVGRVREGEAELLEAREALRMIGVAAAARVTATERRVESAIAALRDQIAQLDAAHARSESELASLDAEIAATERALAHLTIRAPESGIITFAEPIVVGDRVEPGTRVFSVSPSELVAIRAAFANRDAGMLRPGAECRVKLAAYPFERFGTLRGRVERIALEPTVDPATGASTYDVRIAVERIPADDERGITLRAGLALDAEIVTERPRIASLLFEPVARLLGGVEATTYEASPLDLPAPLAQRAATTEFDGARAFEDLRAIAGHGPRPHGSEALSAARSHVLERLAAAGVVAERYPFRVPSASGEREFENVYAAFGPEDASEFIVLVAHLDTVSSEGMSGFEGANEGASGCAVLLECARVLAKSAPSTGVLLAFVDGKDAPGRAGSDSGLHGAQALALELRERSTTVGAVVAVDMVGDPHLRFTNELRSTQALWRRLGLAAAHAGLRDRLKLSRDDAIPVDVRANHVPFLREGFPAVLLCDFDFGGRDDLRRVARNRRLRTETDRVDYCSAASLQATGDLLLTFIARW